MKKPEGNRKKLFNKIRVVKHMMYFQVGWTWGSLA